MGNNGSHKRTKAPRQAHKEKSWQKQFFSHLKQKKPSHPVGERPQEAGRTEISLLSRLDKRQQLDEAAAGPGARSGRPGEDASGNRVGSPAAAPMLRGAGDGGERRAREMKMLVLLLLLDARLQEEGCHAAAGAGTEVAQGRQRLDARLLTGGEGGPAEPQPRRRRPRPRPRP
ncbi:uncharacterized protein C20orf144 homolog [Cynocephalus volans]|uniref:uncharacterized protein C20orf144 homolog n=1 Tax=Cynocephalus volans TaxID=110931 RepID=UPI002FC797F3